MLVPVGWVWKSNYVWWGGMGANGCVQVCADGTRSHQEYIRDTSM